MILSRVIEHVKQQHWTAVFLDFIIVVVGILIAFQITEWSGARQERARERVVLAGIADEIRANIAEAEQSLRYANAKRESVRELLTRSAGEPANDEPTGALMSDLLYWNISFMQDGALQNVLLGGDLSIIQDNTLRQRLAAIPGRFKNLERIQSQDYETLKERVLPYLESSGYLPQLYNQLRGFPGTREELNHNLNLPLSESLHVDYDILLNDARFGGILARVYANQTDAALIRNLKGELEITLEMTERRLNELGGPP